MVTARVNNLPRLPALYAQARGISDRSIMLFDVGVSRGLDEHWQGLGDVLRGVGFDPLVAEVERLQSENQNPNVRFVDAFVVGPEDGRPDADPGVPSDHPFYRSSAAEATRLLDFDYQKEEFNKGKPVVLSEQRFTLDQYSVDHDVADVDFIKVDTDGYDFSVLRGAKETLRRCSVLGLGVEVQFHGRLGDRANIFSNIDRFLREEGFTLFDIDVYRYTRATLPGRFSYRLFGPTVDGQAQYGDAVYFRDLAYTEQMRRFGFDPSPNQILKCACLMEAFGQNDSATEVLIAHRESLEDHIDVSEWLDALTPDASSYSQHLRRFRSDPRSFMPPER